jgi:hypothetical protein
MLGEDTLEMCENFDFDWTEELYQDGLRIETNSAQRCGGYQVKR